MSRQIDLEPNLSFKFEAVFSLFIVVLAFLSKNNPQLILPQIYYFFLLLLALNLATGISLRYRHESELLSVIFIIGNCATITGVLAYSGGSESTLWVLYLLPIFATCVFLDGLHVVLITAGTILFNGVFYIGPTWSKLFFDTELFQLGVKTATIVFSSTVTWRIVARNRLARKKLIVERDKINQLETQIESQETQILQIERLADVGQIAAGVAHDINNPLTVILGSVKLLLEDEETSVAFKTDLERILRSATLCQNIVGNLLDLSRNRSFSTVPTDLTDLIRTTLSIYQRSMEQSGIRVVQEMSAFLPLVSLSVPQFQRVLLNLIINSKSAMKHGGILTIRTRHIGLSDPSVLDGVQIEVEDTGSGISEEFMEKLFKPFNSTKSPSEGLGLGLYLSREIIMRHGGRLEAANKSGGGARFTITLPINMIAKRDSTSSADNKTVQTMAVVDDEPGVRLSIKRYLEQRGCAVRLAETGAQAIEILKGDDSPLIWIVDVRLPDMDGRDLVKKIEEKNPESQIVMISGLEDESTIKERGPVKFDQFVSKPIDLRTFDTLFSLKSAGDRT